MNRRIQAVYHKMLPLLIYLVFLAITGIVGNTMSIVFYSKHAKRASTSCFIVGLSTVDLSICFTMVCEIPDMFFRFIDQTDVGCKTATFVYTIQIMMSMSILCVIAYDRYRKICTPFKVNLTTKQSPFILIVVLLFVISISVPSIFHYESQNVEFDETNQTLCFSSASQRFAILHWASYCIHGVLALVVLSTLIYTYGRIAHTIKINNFKLKQIVDISRNGAIRTDSCHESVKDTKEKNLSKDKSIQISYVNNNTKEISISTETVNISKHFAGIQANALDIKHECNHFVEDTQEHVGIANLDRKPEYVAAENEELRNSAIMDIAEDNATTDRKFEDTEVRQRDFKGSAVTEKSYESVSDRDRELEDTAGKDRKLEGTAAKDRKSEDTAATDRKSRDCKTSSGKAHGDVFFSHGIIDRRVSLERVLTLTVFVVTVSYLLCISPFFVVQAGNFRLHFNRNFYTEIAWRSVYLSCASDPLILLGFNPVFRRRFLSCLKCKSKS